MSRTQKTQSPMHVPKKAKRAYRRSKKAKDKQALRLEKDPERDPRSDSWKYL